MSDSALFTAAATQCPVCPERVVRYEWRWHVDGDGVWRLGPCTRVCAAGHASVVEPLAP